jgi:CBS domain-containing protein
MAHEGAQPGEPARNASNGRREQEARILSRHDVRAILVVDASDEFAGVISDSELLRRLLPPYLEASAHLQSSSISF